MSIKARRDSFGLWKIDRKKYFLFAGLLSAAALVLPGFAVSAGFGSGWLLLFMARTRDIGRLVWSLPSLLLAGLGISAGQIGSALSGHFGAEWSGWFLIALLFSTLVFAVVLGCQRSAVAPEAS